MALAGAIPDFATLQSIRREDVIEQLKLLGHEDIPSQLVDDFLADLKRQASKSSVNNSINRSAGSITISPRKKERPPPNNSVPQPHAPALSPRSVLNSMDNAGELLEFKKPAPVSMNNSLDSSSFLQHPPVLSPSGNMVIHAKPTRHGVARENSHTQVRVVSKSEREAVKKSQFSKVLPPRPLRPGSRGSENNNNSNQDISDLVGEEDDDYNNAEEDDRDVDISSDRLDKIDSVLSIREKDKKRRESEKHRSRPQAASHHQRNSRHEDDDDDFEAEDDSDAYQVTPSAKPATSSLAKKSNNSARFSESDRVLAQPLSYPSAIDDKNFVPYSPPSVSSNNNNNNSSILSSASAAASASSKSKQSPVSTNNNNNNSDSVRGRSSSRDRLRVNDSNVSSSSATASKSKAAIQSNRSPSLSKQNANASILSSPSAPSSSKPTPRQQTPGIASKVSIPAPSSLTKKKVNISANEEEVISSSSVSQKDKKNKINSQIQSAPGSKKAVMLSSKPVHGKVGFSQPDSEDDEEDDGSDYSEEEAAKPVSRPSKLVVIKGDDEAMNASFGSNARANQQQHSVSSSAFGKTQVIPGPSSVVVLNAPLSTRANFSDSEDDQQHRDREDYSSADEEGDEMRGAAAEFGSSRAPVSFHGMDSYEKDEPHRRRQNQTPIPRGLLSNRRQNRDFRDESSEDEMAAELADIPSSKTGKKVLLSSRPDIIDSGKNSYKFSPYGSSSINASSAKNSRSFISEGEDSHNLSAARSSNRGGRVQQQQPPIAGMKRLDLKQTSRDYPAYKSSQSARELTKRDGDPIRSHTPMSSRSHQSVIFTNVISPGAAASSRARIPNSMPPPPAFRKADPVSKFNQMRDAWRRDSFLTGSTNGREKLRWEVRTKMLVMANSAPSAQVTPRTRPQVNNYTVPTENRRDALRFAKRVELMQYGN